MQTVNRSELSWCLAKALAYAQCGKPLDARVWAAKLVAELQCAEILTEEWRPYPGSTFRRSQTIRASACAPDDPSGDLNRCVICEGLVAGLGDLCADCCAAGQEAGGGAL